MNNIEDREFLISRGVDPLLAGVLLVHTPIRGAQVEEIRKRPPSIAKTRKEDMHSCYYRRDLLW